MKQAQKLISSSLLEELFKADVLKDNGHETISTVEGILHKYLSRLGFVYNKEQDFAFLNETATNLAQMFFEESLSVQAASFFKNNRLGGSITDDMIRSCISTVATQVLTTLSIDYKIRLSMYLNGVVEASDDAAPEILSASEELDKSIITYIYFHIRPLLVAKAKEYNAMLVKSTR